MSVHVSRCLCLLLAGASFASTKAGGSTVLIDESFENDTLPENWEPGGRKGSFTIVDGSLRGVAQPDDSHGPSIGVPISGHDLTVEFDVKFINPDGYILFLIDGDSQFSWMLCRGSEENGFYHTGSNGSGFRCVSWFQKNPARGLVILTNATGGKALHTEFMDLLNGKSSA